jgi:hypothetical protein
LRRGGKELSPPFLFASRASRALISLHRKVIQPSLLQRGAIHKVGVLSVCGLSYPFGNGGYRKGIQGACGMSQVVVSIMNPMAPEALAVTLGRKAFLREIALAVLLSLPPSLICLLGVFLFPAGANLVAAAIGIITAVAIFAVPILWYASFRLNAATLARERAVIGSAEQKIYRAMEGPFFYRRSMVAGSVRSRILGGLPITTGGITVFAVMAYVTSGSIFMPLLHVLLGIGLVIEGFVAFELLWSPSLQPHPERSDRA